MTATTIDKNNRNYKTADKLQRTENNKLFYAQNKLLSTQYLSINTLRCRK